MKGHTRKAFLNYKIIYNLLGNRNLSKPLQYWIFLISWKKMNETMSKDLRDNLNSCRISV